MLPEDVIVSSAQELGQLPILCPGPLFFQENSVGAAPLWIQAFRQALSSGTIQSLELPQVPAHFTLEVSGGARIFPNTSQEVLCPLYYKLDMRTLAGGFCVL